MKQFGLNRLTVGGGLVSDHDDFDDSQTVDVTPNSDTLNRSNLFVQNKRQFWDGRFEMTLGAKGRGKNRLSNYCCNKYL